MELKKTKIKIIMLAAIALLMMACSGQKEEKIYDVVDEMPTFAGGDEALMQWLSENVKYPAEAEEQGIAGRVMVRFVVDEEGNVTNPVIKESVDSLLDSEAIRAVSAMPKWTPGKKDGKAVKVYFTLPVNFQLDIEAVVGENGIYDIVEKMPSFPGGNEALMKWLGNNIKYPAKADKNDITGRVIVRFVVDTDGSVKDATILKSVDKLLDDEALRVVNAMPKWTPGEHEGKTVPVHFSLPVTFRK